MKGKENYSSVFRKRRIKKIVSVYRYLDPFKFKNNKFKFNARVLAFGCGIESNNFKKTIRDGGKYFGFDIDEQSIAWLKENYLYVDFWNTKEKFDIITASQVYEHLNHETREKFLQRSYQILNSGGLLIIDFPYVQNIGGFSYWEDRTHLFPPDPIDDSHLAELYGFKSEVYLLCISYYPIYYTFRVVFNLLLGFRPHHTAILILKKNVG